jgi:hypothetical protein
VWCAIDRAEAAAQKLRKTQGKGIQQNLFVPVNKITTMVVD